MRKRNKRKETEFKKPFLVLSRRKIAGWFLLIFFLCAWMFVLGILVGRGTAPVKFDIAALENKLEAAKENEGGDAGNEQTPKEPVGVKDKTKLEFYEALKENKLDPDIPTLQKPEVVEGKIESPAEKTAPQEAKKEPAPGAQSTQDTQPKATPERSESAPGPEKQKPAKQKEKVAVMAPTKAAGPVYTIQAASVRDPKDADRLIEKLKKKGYPAYRMIGKIPGKGIWFRVRIGEYQSKSEALSTMNKLKKDGLKPILVLREM